MRFLVASESHYEVLQRSTIILNVHALRTPTREIVAERFAVEPRLRCEEFAHLGIALCRALSIPARYFSGYACQLEPPDFHACFEAHIGHHWFIFDPTRLVPLNGLVRIANGRDAADASIATMFGSVRSQSPKVSCAPADADFTPWTHRMFMRKELSLEA